MGARQELRVSVKRAVVYSPPGQGVVGVVLENVEKPPGFEHSCHLGNERLPFLSRHVMQNTDGEHDVEGLLSEWYSFSVVELKLSFRNVGRRLGYDARGNVDATKLFEVFAYVPRHEADTTSNIQNAALLQRPELPCARRDQLVRLDADEEIMALTGELDRLFDLGDVALLVVFELHVQSVG